MGVGMLDDEDKKDLMEAFDDLRVELESCISEIIDSPGDATNSQLNRLFRAIHTVKGNAGLMGVSPVVEFSHAIEELASALRKRTITLTELIAETLLIAMDRLHDIHEKELYDKHFEHLRIDELKTLYHALAIAETDEADGMAMQILQLLGAGIADGVPNHSIILRTTSTGS